MLRVGLTGGIATGKTTVASILAELGACVVDADRLAHALMSPGGAVHDAVVLAWKRWTSLRDRAKFDAWFDRIVVNVCRDRLKSAKVRASTGIEHAASIGTPDTTAAVHQRIVVGQALDRLKPDDIVVLTLRHFLDLQLDDIAALLDVPLPTAKTRLRTARERLRSRLERDAIDVVSR